MHVRIICISEIWPSKSGHERNGCLKRSGEDKNIYLLNNIDKANFGRLILPA